GQSQPDDPAVTRARIMAAQADRPGPRNLSPLTYTPCVSGFAGAYPCKNVDLMAFIPLSTMSASTAADLWGWTDPLDGKEYALVGLDNGTGFVDISDPENPVYLGKLPTHSGSLIWRDVEVYGNYAYVGSEASNHGIQVFDLTQLRTVTNPPVTFTETAHYNQVSNTHTIIINEDSGYAFANGTNTCSGGLHIINLQDPIAPTFAGCFSSDGYTHESHCIIYQGPDVEHQDQEICFAANEDTLTIVDVTNKSAPVQLSRTPYSGVGYTHQGWTTADQTYFLLDDELDESFYGHNTRTRVWDISDLDAPTIIGYYSGPTPAIDHNLYVKGGYAYEANYQAGLRILDLSDVANANLDEAAYFDTYPSGNSAAFDGAWGTYPYFASGLVIVSGIDEGLFILRPDLDVDFALTADDTTLDVCQPGSDHTTLDVASLLGFVGSVTLNADNLPAGATAAFDPNPVIVPGASVLTTTVVGAVAGTYPITVTGVGGTITHAIGLSLNVFDALPGTPTPVSPADHAPDQPTRPTFTWTAASQGGSYTLEVATDADFTNVVASAAGILGVSHTLADELVEDTVYYWRVRAENRCGGGSDSAVWSFVTRPPAGQCTTGTTLTELWRTDLETGTEGWTHSGDNDTWATSDARTHSGQTAWYAEALDEVSDQQLVSPPVTLPALQSSSALQFWNYQHIMDRSSASCYDGAILEISSDGGATWTQLETELLTDPYNGPVYASLQNPLADRNAWCGDPQDWLNSVVDVTAYAGQTVQFRFRLGTDDRFGREGWYIDDVAVQSCSPTNAQYQKLYLPVTLKSGE
ncbi:MAG: choice-of-anchor B family protein, partial [Chloroflexota bacterium]